MGCEGCYNGIKHWGCGAWYAHTILDACAALHGDVTGSGSGLTDAERTELRAWLKMRLDGWEMSFGTSVANKHYEMAVAQLAQATLGLGGH